MGGYTRSFSKEIEIPYSGTAYETFSYPASQNGGTRQVHFHYSGVAKDSVNVNVHVDTSPFDASVQNCNSKVNTLTTSVGAMSAAQCKSIADNADAVSDSIINGFFQSVRTDLEAQRVELQQAIQARLLLLRQQGQALANIMSNMRKDYARIAGKYVKIFNDLNKELAVRIRQADEPVFKVADNVNEQNDRMMRSSLVSSAAVVANEAATLSAQIEVASVKRRASEAMGRAHAFLFQKGMSDSNVSQSLHNDVGDSEIFAPVCIFEANGDDGKPKLRCELPYAVRDCVKGVTDVVKGLAAGVKLGKPSPDESAQIKSFIQSEISARVKGDDAHSVRVKSVINSFLAKL